MASLLFQPSTRRPAGRLGSFQGRVQQIEADFAAGIITPAMRRDLLIQARDASGVADLLNRIAPPSRAQTGKDIAMSRTEINATKRAGRSRHDRARG